MIPVISIVLAIGLPTFALWKNGKKPIRHPYLFSIDLKSARQSKITMELIALLEAEGMIEEASPGMHKSLTITDAKAYLSPISSVTLKNRLRYWLGSEKEG